MKSTNAIMPPVTARILFCFLNMAIIEMMIAEMVAAKAAYSHSREIRNTHPDIAKTMAQIAYLFDLFEGVFSSSFSISCVTCFPVVSTQRSMKILYNIFFLIESRHYIHFHCRPL